MQGHLETCLARMTGAATPVVGASRTDAGVHAEGQVAHFDTSADIPVHGFRRGLNGLLPPGIAVVAADEVGPDFHARFSAAGKRYRYALLSRADRSPLLRHRTWHRPRPLDLEAMRAAARPLVGEHDFSAFRAAGCSARHAVRRITGIELRRDGDLVLLEVTGNAFLRNMVRILAGSLVAAGEGRLDPGDFAAILASRQRERAGQTAPPQGLTLVEVFYEPH